MKRRAIAAVLIGTALLSGACGCSLSDISKDNMLRPPKTMGDEAEIERLIASHAKGGYTLKYPKSGSNRSAILMHDLDGDSHNEAVAFFRDKDGSTGVHMLVMADNSGKWEVTGDVITETTDVDCVDFADVTGDATQEILAGYATYTAGMNFLSVYAYSDGKITNIDAGQNYSAFYCGSLDSDSRAKVFTLSLFTTENEARATLLEYDESQNALVSQATVPMDGGVTGYRSVAFSNLDDSVKGLVVDGLLAGGDMNTQVLYYDEAQNRLRNPLHTDKESNPTQRSSTVVCANAGTDMKYEIPTVTSLPFNGKSGANSAADELIWNRFDVRTASLVPVTRTAANYSYGYTVRLPESWVEGSFTVLLNENDSQMSFCEWNGDSPGVRLFDVTVFKSSDWEQGKDTDGYSLIYKDNRFAFAFVNHHPDSAMALGDNEIKTAFSLLGKGNAANGKS